MPNGTIATNELYGLMILGDDKVWYVLPDKTAFKAGEKVTFKDSTPKNGPPGFHYASDVAVVKRSYASLFSPSSESPVTVQDQLIPDTHKKSTSSGSPTTSNGNSSPSNSNFMTRTQSRERVLDKDTQYDYDAIMKAVDRMNWSGKFGPSVVVETKLKWENAKCRNLYLKVKDELQDSRIPGTKLYYYLGKIGNWGKAGFRISGHTKTSDKVAQAETHGVLHVENS